MSLEKYSKDERLNIGRRIYTREINASKAAVIYGISVYTARDYLRYYKAYISVENEEGYEMGNYAVRDIEKSYHEMSRDELIDEIMKLQLNGSA